MRKPDGSGSSRAGLVGLAFLLAGCAPSAATKVPQMPQPPSSPSPPSAGAGATGEKQAETSKQATPRSEAATGARRGGSEAAAGEAKTPDERQSALDGQLHASMAEFDGMLLKEQKALEEKQRREPLPERGEGAGGGGGAGAGESGDPRAGSAGGGKAGSSGSKDDRTPGERRAEAEARKGKAGEEGSTDAPATDQGTGGSKDAGRLEGGAPVTAPVEGGPRGPGSDSGAAPPDVGDGRNDDVVARQLREAAMKEKDPAIRAKLWDEYREYKKSSGKGNS